jgi:hypothetical protein
MLPTQQVAKTPCGTVTHSAGQMVGERDGALDLLLWYPAGPPAEPLRLNMHGCMLRKAFKARVFPTFSAFRCWYHVVHTIAPTAQTQVANCDQNATQNRRSSSERASWQQKQSQVNIAHHNHTYTQSGAVQGLDHTFARNVSNATTPETWPIFRSRAIKQSTYKTTVERARSRAVYSGAPGTGRTCNCTWQRTS